MAADFADGPCAPVAGMQAGMWAVTQAGYPHGCRQHPSASQMANSSQGAICLKTAPYMNQ